MVAWVPLVWAEDRAPRATGMVESTDQPWQLNFQINCLATAEEGPNDFLETLGVFGMQGMCFASGCLVSWILAPC